MALTVQQFGERLVDSGIVDRDVVQRLITNFPAVHAREDGEQFARWLVGQKVLTKYQAQQLYGGNAQSLLMGGYLVLDKLGQGGMGAVFKAEHRRMKRLVALKTLARSVLKTREGLARFQREVEAAARLHHPNIVMAFDAGEAHGTPFLAMEYVEGEDLAHVVKTRGPCSPELAIRCVLDAARGLQYAHARGVVHRDIKPSNLLLDRHHTVKVLDLGLAHLDSAGNTEAQLTGTNQIMGTVDFMPPEQALDPKNIDARADIYSLGITLWYLLTGRAVFEGDSVVAKLLAHREAPVPSLPSACPGAPPQLDAIFQRMVAKAPDDRYPHMGEVIADLEQCLAVLDGSSSARPLVSAGDIAQTRRNSIHTSADEPLRSRWRSTGSERAIRAITRNRLVTIGAACLLTMSGVALAIYGYGQRSDQSPDAPKQQETSGAPLPAVAPFDATQARQHQSEWAQYLGVPIEKEIELPGGVRMVLTLIPPGEFQMGASAEERTKYLQAAQAEGSTWAAERIPSEGPQHRVRITRPFYMGKYEVTQAQWQAVMGTNPSKYKDDPSLAVDHVNWDELQPFLEWLNSHFAAEHMTFALPTEAQWEYACRAGTETVWHSGDTTESLLKYAWFPWNAKGRPHTVGQMLPNQFGLHDMHGSVWEWCADWFEQDYYSQSPVDDPTGPATGWARVNRGGRWNLNPEYCRSASRYLHEPSFRKDMGFRVVAHF